MVIPCQWIEAEDFKDGIALVQDDSLWDLNKGGRYGYIDKSGNVVISCQWSRCYGFTEGLSVVWGGPNFKAGLIDKSGTLVIGYQYDVVYPFKNGVAIVSIRTKDNVVKKGFIDKEGNPLL